jgi:hypothetical protein
MNARGESGATLGRHQSAQFTFRTSGDRIRTVETLFWAEPGMAVLPAGYAWCLATEFDCQIRSRDGAHLRTIRATMNTAAVTEGDVAELTAMRLADAPGPADTARIRSGILEADRMPRFPVMSLIRTDPRGRIWMRPYLWRASDRVARWLVLEPTGTVLGTVALPSDLQVFDLGDDYILGVERDEDDAEQVVMYRYVPTR